LTAGLAVAAAWCCGAARAEPETVTLSYWGNEYDVLSDELLEDFENLHDGSGEGPAIQVIMGQSASINQTDDPQRLLCSIAGGDPPDVVWFDRFAVAEWAARGAFMKLQPFIERDLAERPDDPYTLDPEDFYAPCWDEACYEDELYAVPADADNRGMYYNEDLLEKYAEELMAAGCVDPDDPGRVGPPRTWTQLRAAAEIMTERDDGGRLIQVGFIPMFGNSWLCLYGWLNGGRFLSEDGGTCTLAAEENVEALTYVTEMYEAMGGVAEVAAFVAAQAGSDLDPFMAGKVAMRIDVSGLTNAIATVKPEMRFNAVLPPAPAGMPRFGWSGGFSWVIPEGCKHPEEAWKLVKYLASKRAFVIRTEAAQRLARGTGSIFIPEVSARRDITEWAMEEYLYKDPTVAPRFKESKRVIIENLPESRFRPVTPAGHLLWNQQRRATESALYREPGTGSVEGRAGVVGAGRGGGSGGPGPVGVA
jgi:multiple sugar transport system permease protein